MNFSTNFTESWPTGTATAAAPASYAVDVLPVGLRAWHHVNSVLTTALSLALNAALIWLLRTERSETLGAYKRVLFQNCAVDVAASVASGASEYQFDFVDGRIIGIVNGALGGLPLAWHYAVTAAWVAPVCASCLVPTIFFYFRYRLITKGRAMSSSALSSIFFAVVAWSTLEGVWLGVALARNHDALHAGTCRELLGAFAVWMTEDVSRCMVSKPNDPFLRAFHTVALCNDCVVYSTMSYCTFATVRHLHKAGYSHRTMKLQKQLNQMLACQMIIPVFTTIIPIGTMGLFTALKITVPGAGIATAMAFAWLPLVSPLTTICFVSSFRRKLLRIFYIRPLCVIFPHRCDTSNNGAAVATGGDTTLHKSVTGVLSRVA